MQQQTLLRLPRVMDVVAKPRSSIYADIKAGTFPKPVKTGMRSVAWKSQDIESWLTSRPVSDIVPPSKRSAA